jgi:hypothetical protein
MAKVSSAHGGNRFVCEEPCKRVDAARHDSSRFIQGVTGRPGPDVLLQQQTGIPDKMRA